MAPSAAGSATSNNSSSSSGNQPRNLLLTNAANVPFQYDFVIPNRRNQTSIVVRQQDDEETWPGGAIWDLGILLASLCVACAGGSACTLTLLGGGGHKPKQYPIQLPDRLGQKIKNDSWFRKCWAPSSNLRWIELGCGVGLTGLVAAAALRPSAMLLTDLDVVVDQVTQSNVKGNEKLYKGVTHCRAMPLCWGNANDIATMKSILQDLYKPPTSSNKPSRRKTKGHAQSTTTTSSTTTVDPLLPTCADVVLIGDVAYQHKPAAPSHFDVLHETLLQLIHDETLVIFGTRIRMPASVDLLELFRQDLEEVVVPPISVDEIDNASFANVKHNMTIHFMRKRRDKPHTRKESANNE